MSMLLLVALLFKLPALIAAIVIFNIIPEVSIAANSVCDNRKSYEALTCLLKLRKLSLINNRYTNFDHYYPRERPFTWEESVDFENILKEAAFMTS